MSTTAEAARRRTFAVIAHPDAGKSTLTEALALHAHVISEAGAVHGKGGRKSTVSDWMDMEKDRGISIASSALQFEYAPESHEGEPYVINLVDTPGHADFSEDTYRVLSAVDAAVMLIDAAKGLEPQTLKLFRVCKARGLPIVTVINKWDRVGREPLELVDEIVTEIDLQPTPLYWPVGEAGDFRGLAHVSGDGTVDEYIHFTRTAGGSTIAPEEHFAPAEAEAKEKEVWETAVEEAELLLDDGALHDQQLFEQCVTSPIIFASAMLNFGVHQILDTLCAIAPAPRGREADPQAVEASTTAMDSERGVDDDFSGVVFKVQAGMDRNHRDTLAFMRVVSGEFDRGMQVTHAQSGRTFSTKYALTVFGRSRDTVETAYPGDIIGLVNAGALAPGDTIYAGRSVRAGRKQADITGTTVGIVPRHPRRPVAGVRGFVYCSRQAPRSGCRTGNGERGSDEQRGRYWQRGDHAAALRMIAPATSTPPHASAVPVQSNTAPRPGDSSSRTGCAPIAAPIATPASGSAASTAAVVRGPARAAFVAALWRSV